MANTIEFHDLAGAALEPALGALLEGLLIGGGRAVVRLASAERLAAVDAALWTYHPASFLPHGSAVTGNAEQQPVWLTTAEENPNRARVLVLLEDADAGRLETFERCIYIFDRSDADARRRARARWREWRESGVATVYLECVRGVWRTRDE